MKVFFIFTLFLAISVGVKAQTNELTLDKGVSANKALDAIYQQFSDAYRSFDAEKVAGLYTTNATYLPPESEILQGREEILPTFRGFFDWVKSQGQTITISFRIVQRKVEKNMAFDVGIYTTRQFKDGKEVEVSAGKFMTVAVREKGNVWRFQSETYNSLPPPKKQ